ncbi:ribosome-recycling factor-like [Tubulanus polymorphus]|uniref:ribosome-recycling factor-like n=1 Tax=Tubulanus polymorphus TaxID=672921 RepID=UPI003DA5C355
MMISVGRRLLITAAGLTNNKLHSPMTTLASQSLVTLTSQKQANTALVRFRCLDKICLQSPQLQHIRLKHDKNKAKKDKSKGKKGAKLNVSLSDEEINQAMNYERFTSQMNAVTDQLKQDYLKHLSVRTNAGVFESLQIVTDDGKFPLNQLAQVVQKNPTLLSVNLGPCPQYIPAVKDALEKSGMNINPQQDGNTLFIPLPKVTREHREYLVKSAKTLCDKSKDKLRGIYNSSVKTVKKKKELSSDLLRNVEELLLYDMHKYSEQLEKIMQAKQDELLGGK